jgi:hypothetical protein
MVKPDPPDQILQRVLDDLVLEYRELSGLELPQFREVFSRVVVEHGLADQIEGRRKKGPKQPYYMMKNCNRRHLHEA